ncbi:MAG: hypothetical protein HF978_00925 [Desulfobacteraceae bacterium]|nr:hypothetical protein [Desulfobacteraceae bacterium]MBC2754094.1 hypothetical protein [Desulfobacteraceae bacterium]
MVQQKKPTPRNNSKSPLSPTAEEILRQQQRILDSPEFNATKAQIAFLKFVVKKTISGDSDEIKGYTVATQVFGRKKDFDQNTDPIVSIHANKLRRALEHYYLTAGTHDTLRIDIPRGTYVPTFSIPAKTYTDKAEPNSSKPEMRHENSWPRLLVRPFKCLTGDADENYLSIGLATELAIELTRYQDIRVIFQDPHVYGRRLSDTGIRFVIDGSIRRDLPGIKVSIRLNDTKTDTQLWGDTHKCDLDPSQLSVFEEEVARIIAVRVAGEHGIISNTLASESKIKPPSELTTYEAILRYHEFDRTLTSESFLRAMEALEYAARIEPGCGQVWSMLGRLYGNIYSLEFPCFESALEKSIAFAEKGVRMNPDNQRARTILALNRIFNNEIPAALEEAEKALALNPNSLSILDGIGYLLTLLGEWKRGRALIKRAIQLNPYYGLYVHYALWVDWVRQEEYEQAHLETLNFSRPSIFWEPLMKAATLGQLGRFEEGKQAVKNLLNLKPDFQTRGLRLIKHYIKFEDIIERMVNGLNNSGLKIELSR